MKSDATKKNMLWFVLALVVVILFIRLLDSTLGAIIGKAGEIVILVVVIIILLWIIGSRERK